MFKFIHAADIHLDSPLKGLEQYEGAPVDEIRGATRRAFENLVDLAIREEVQFLLLAGDLYDGDWKDHNTGLYFVRQMFRLRDAGIPVVAISGNHDAANKMTKSLPLPDNVEMLSHNQVQTASLPKLAACGAAVHGRSFAKQAEFENLALEYPTKLPGMFNIGLLHTSLAGAEGHEPYAPCSLADLRSKGYDYSALGHVHERKLMANDPPVVFPGNIQGRHIREPGAKGCYLVAVDDRGHANLEFRSVDVLRWETCRVPAAGAERADDVLDMFAGQLEGLMQRHEQMPLAVRVVLSGRCHAHEQLVADPIHWINRVRLTALEVGRGNVWIEKVKFRTSPKRVPDETDLRDGPLGTLFQYFRELQHDDEELRLLAGELGELKKKLPDDLLRGDDGLLLENSQWLREVLGEVEPLLAGRLHEEAEE